MLLAVILIGQGSSLSLRANTIIHRIDGPPLYGEAFVLTGDELQVNVKKKAKPSKLPRKGLIAIRFEDHRNRSAEGSILEFANGDRLIATVLDVREGELLVRAFGQTIPVPLGHLRGIVWNRTAIAATDRQLLFRKQGAEDVVLLTNGDRIAGRFAGASMSEVTMLLDENEVTIPNERLAMLAFSPELISKPKLPVTRQIVVSRAGWITVTDLTGSSNSTFTGQTLFGGKITIAAEDIQRLQFFSPQVVSLTDLEWSAVEMTPWLSHTWPVRENRSPTDHPLALEGQAYPRGLGVHSNTRITYPLGGDYDRFSVKAGLAESAGALGNVSIAIAVDGKVVARRDEVTLVSGPVDFNDIPLAGADSLSLIVDFGANGNIRDRVNWCAPVLIRSTEPQ